MVVAFLGGPFAPQHSAGVTIRDLTAKIAQAAKRKMRNQPHPDPDPASLPWTIDYILATVTPVLAVAVIMEGLKDSFTSIFE